MSDNCRWYYWMNLIEYSHVWMNELEWYVGVGCIVVRFRTTIKIPSLVLES